jgi:hypothetical protein
MVADDFGVGFAFGFAGRFEGRGLGSSSDLGERAWCPFPFTIGRDEVERRRAVGFSDFTLPLSFPGFALPLGFSDFTLLCGSGRGANSSSPYDANKDF